MFCSSVTKHLSVEMHLTSRLTFQDHAHTTNTNYSATTTQVRIKLILSTGKLEVIRT